MRFVLVLAFLTTAAFAYPSGSRIPAGNAGEPGTGTPCAGCHSLTLNPANGSVALEMPGGLTYEAGATQTWTLRTSDPNSSRRYGYQLAVSAGTLSSANGVKVNSNNGRIYMSQTASASSYTIEWTPPADASGPLEVYVAGLAASGTRSGSAYTAAYTLTAATQGPTLRSESPVVSLATGAAEISAGSLVALYGENLKADGETPAVRINGLEAQLISATSKRIVALAPADDTRGAVGVVVSTPRGDTPSVEVTRVDSAAALMPRNGIALARHLDGSLVTQPGELEDPWLGRPVKSGETVLVALTAVPADADLARIQVFVADLPCVVEALEEWSAGIQRLRIVLPELEAGDLAVRVVLDEKALPKELVIPVR